MKTKKLFSGMLAAVLATAAMGASLTATAADSVGVKIGTADAEAGQTFTIDVELSNVPSSGLSTVDFAIKYDKSLITISDVSLGTIANTGAKNQEGEYGDTLFGSKVYDDQIVAIWATGLTDSTYWIKSSGKFLTITGKVNDGVASGTVAKLEAVAVNRPEYPSGSANSDIVFSALGADNSTDYVAAITNGAVNIGGGGGKVVWGDADCNGTFELSDLVMLAKAGTGLGELSVAGKTNCDMNTDSSVNSTDLKIALQLMAGIYTTADMPLK